MKLDRRPLLGFAPLALIDVALLATDGRASRAATAQAALIALAHDLAPACIAGLVVPHLSRRAAFALLAAVCAALGCVALADDFHNLAARLGAGRWLAFVLGALLAESVVIAARLGLFVRERALPWRIAVTGTGLLAQLAGHVFLARSYAGLHLALFGCAGALIAGATAPRALGKAAPFGALALVGGAVLAPLPPHLTAVLLRHSGIAVTPFVARARMALAGAQRPRGRLVSPAQPPTRPALPIERPIVILITIDALRADVLERHAQAAPRLAALEAESVVFTNARSPGASTVVTLSSIFRGQLYSQLRWTVHPEVSALFPHEDTSPSFPGVLEDSGVATTGVDGTLWMAERFGVSAGFGARPLIPRDAGEYASAPPMIEAVLAAARAAGDRPAFVFAHLLEPHTPYDRAGVRGPPFERYLGEVGLADAAVGALVDGLRSAQLWDRAVLIVSSDHGEAFGEHGTSFHGLTVYEELVRVPLLIRAPGVAPRRAPEPVSLLDLGPTVLDLNGVATPPGFLGTSLVPALRGERLPIRPIPIESGRRLQAMVYPDGTKVIVDRRSGAAELFDLEQDPREEHNLFDDLGEVRPQLDETLDFFDRASFSEDGYEAPFRPL